MIDINIKDGLSNGFKAEVTSQNAVKVATEEYYTYSTVAQFFMNTLYGIDLNRNFSSDVGEIINDGGDTTAWVGIQTIGTSINFNDTNNPKTGSYNISITDSDNGDIAFFERGSDLTITNELSLEGQVYITSLADNKSEINLTAWDTGLNVAVGKEETVYNYVNQNTLDEWQTFNIPITDLELQGQTFDALRMNLDKNGQYVDLDNIKFTVAGGAGLGTQVFTIEPGRGRQLVIDGFNIIMADDYAGTVTEGTMPNIPYDGFLGLDPLENGMLFRVINNVDEITFTATITDLIEIFQFGNVTFSGHGSDGVNTWFSLNINLAAPIILNDDEKDKIELVLSDNLSELLWFRWSTVSRQRTIF